MSEIVRYESPATGDFTAGIRADGVVHALSGTISELLRLPLNDLRARCDAAADGTGADEAHTSAPIDGRMEVWAAGVTYQRSRDARMIESEAAPDVYDRVYSAERPELFFKSAAWRVVGDGGDVAVRRDSVIDVPEPELAVVVNAHQEIVGYTVCDDVSSRTIEGENPLYLPQAKVYLGGCALGPSIRPAWEIADPYQLEIRMQIYRDDAVVWEGAASTARLNRRIDDLVEYLFVADEFPDGVVLATGTCVVPELPFTLADGDQIAIEIDEIGRLATGVVRRGSKS